MHYRPSHHYISIHASAREATIGESASDFTAVIFQSTPPRGRRLRLNVWQSTADDISIHASAREATRVVPPVSCRAPLNFNPRLREGGDCTGTRPGGWCYVFQSTPPRGRRPDPSIFDECRGISIHASAREATALITKIHLKHHISFQHTVHKSPFNVNYPFQ